MNIQELVRELFLQLYNINMLYVVILGAQICVRAYKQ